MRRLGLLLPLSLSLTLRGASALVLSPAVPRAALVVVRGRALSCRAPPVLARPPAPAIKHSLGLVLLLGGTASGLALQLRSSRGDGVRCEAAASAPDERDHRPGGVNELPGGLVTTEHFFSLPLRHEDPEGPHIEVFVRELGLTKNKGSPRLPPLLFLQGGPGFAAGRPVSADSGWIKRALQSHSVFLLDQRGTLRTRCRLFSWRSPPLCG